MFYRETPGLQMAGDSIVLNKFSGRAFFAAVIACLLASCAPGSGEGLDGNGRPVGEGGGGGPLVAEFGSIQANVLTPTCALSGCHSGAAAPQGLRLDANASYALLVGVPSNQVPALLRVAPGDPDSSYLIQKIEGTAAVGGRMPLNGPPYLDQATIDIIRQWVTDGAQPAATGGDEPPQVVSVEPADGATLDQLPSAITVIFNQDMDGSLFSDSTVVLTRSGGDSTFGDGNEVIVQPLSVALDAGNPRLATVDLAGVASTADDYELRLAGTGATAIASARGIVLDGDSDGTAGGDFVSGFSVVAVAATLESIQETVFTPTCAVSGCHTGPAGSGLPAGQDLSNVGASFASLVNVPSEQEPTLLRVDPGNADASYLVQKIEGTAASGSRMPLGGAPLAQASIDNIRAWIDAGADSGGTDVTAPTVTLQAIASPASGDVLLSATAQDDTGVARVDFLLDAAVIGTVAGAPWEILWDSTTVADGDYEFSATAVDAAGNTGSSATQAVTVVNGIDSTPPTVSLGAPASPLAGTVTLTATASDNVGVTRVEFFAGGTLIGSDTTSPFEIQWDTNSVANGTYDLTAMASDAAGNTTESAAQSRSVVNDRQAPTVSIASPQDGDDVSGLLLVTVSASDDVAVTSVELLVDNAVTATDSAAPWEFVWDTGTVADERYELVARARDAAGNSTDSEIVRVDVDNSNCAADPNAPSVSITAPAPGLVSGTVTVSADATDDVGVTLVAFYADGELIGTASAAPYSTAWNTTARGNGDVSLTAEASDGCNATLSVPVTVTVENEVGVFGVTSVSPADGALEVDFPASVVVSMTSTPSASSVNASTFVLERSGGDGTFGDGNEVVVSAPVAVFGTQASIDLTDLLPSVEDSYQVTLSGTVIDVDGNQLDGDGDGEPGGDFVARFDTDLTTYVANAQPIFQEKCDTCHTGDGNGGHNVGSVYADALLAADDNACAGLTVGECTIVRIQSGEMPLGAGCSGDPAQDAGNASCLTAGEQDVIQSWIDDRLPE